MLLVLAISSRNANRSRAESLGDLGEDEPSSLTFRFMLLGESDVSSVGATVSTGGQPSSGLLILLEKAKPTLPSLDTILKAIMNAFRSSGCIGSCFAGAGLELLIELQFLGRDAHRTGKAITLAQARQLSPTAWASLGFGLRYCSRSQARLH